MKTRLSIAIFLLAAFCAPCVGWAQAASISGSVKDASTGEALAAANIVVMQRSAPQARAGGASDASGQYVIVVPFEGVVVARFSYVGYRAQTREFTVSTGSTARFDIRLEADLVGLDEVVVTGVASRAEKNRAEVAVARLDASELLEGNAYQDVSQLLAAKIPGLRVTPSSGTLGGGIAFSMRSGGGLFGSGQPLIYLDGVRIANDEIGDFTGGQFVSTLADLNPEDIENIEVLKGPASAALYGTSGSNGVIRITTKRGRRGAGGSDIGYKIASGWNEQAMKYTRDMALTYDDANALFRTGPVTEQSVHVSGRAPHYDYYASYANRSETGILPNNTLGRNSFRLNAGLLPSDLFRINVSANALFSDTRRPLNDNSIIGMLGNTLIFGPAEAGGQGTYFFADSAAVQGVVSDTRTRRFIGSVEAELTPLPTLALRGLVGYDGSSWRSEQTYPSNLDYSRIGVMQGWRAVSDNALDLVNVDLSARWLWTLNNRVTASTIIGAQAFLRTLRGTSLTKSEFPSDLITTIGAGSRFEQGGEQFADSREAGVFFQQDVAFDERIFLSAGVRNDYASAIGADAPSVWYPRAGVALRLDRFGWLPPFFTLAKLRAAYGEAGILPGPLDGSGLRWGALPTGSGTGAALVFIGNPSIEPERVKELEIGMEVEFSASAGFDVTLYRQYARNSIISFLNPPSTGLTATATPRNVGAIDGEGVEAGVYARFFRSAETQLDARLVWNYATNTVKELGGASPVVESMNAITVGSPRFAFRGYAVTGATFAPDGSYIGPLVDTEMSDLGNPVPEHSGSLSATLRIFRNLSLSAMADFSLGSTIYNRTRKYQTLYNNNGEYNALATQLGVAVDYGITPVPGVAALPIGSAEYRTAADRFAKLDPLVPGATGFFESGDFLRLREVNIRYDLTDALRGVFQHTSGRVSIALAARNIALFTDYSGPDIEVNSTGARGLVHGQDFLTLQNPRTYYAMLTIGL